MKRGPFYGKPCYWERYTAWKQRVADKQMESLRLQVGIDRAIRACAEANRAFNMKPTKEV